MSNSRLVSIINKNFLSKSLKSVIKRTNKILTEFAFVPQPIEFEHSFQKLPLISEASTIQNGDVIKLGSNCIKKNKKLVFSAVIESFDRIVFRHGNKEYGSAFIVLDTTKIEIFDYTTDAFLKHSEQHKLSLIDKINVSFESSNKDTIVVTLSTESGTYISPPVWWAGGCRGSIEVEVEKGTLTDVKILWDCEDFAKKTWVFGDSYLGISNPCRWPSHIISSGLDTALFSGFPGARTQDVYTDFINCLSLGKPKFAVWCLGMNNSDNSILGINKAWRIYTEAFIRECVNNGIIPVLATIPNTPVINNEFKNKYIKNSGYRYIDFAKAVGAFGNRSRWHNGMLSPDNVHPTELGAKALANQVLTDFPEIKH